jgi:hypothetical protein
MLCRTARQVIFVEIKTSGVSLKNHMNLRLAMLLAAVFIQPKSVTDFNTLTHPRENTYKNNTVFPAANSWPYFLQHLQVTSQPVVDYRGRIVPDAKKAAGILSFDVGKQDLQQCADALMRLRAEYLFEQKRYNEIGFHFVSGYYYTWNEFCSGKRPDPNGNTVRMTQGAPSGKTHASLRNYLDIVYTYASTISLAKELKKATDFEVGTVVIHAGSPGHCFIIIDEKKAPDGTRLFKLAEGYTPAQSIYVLKGLSGDDPWYALKRGVIETVSYEFERYELKKFE